MPQSNNQTSPRLGGTLFLMEDCCQCVACGSSRVIIERPRVPRRQVVHYFSHELLLLLDWQRLELGKQFCCSSSHGGKEYCTKSIAAKIDLLLRSLYNNDHLLLHHKRRCQPQDCSGKRVACGGSCSRCRSLRPSQSVRTLLRSYSRAGERVWPSRTSASAMTNNNRSVREFLFRCE